MDKWINEEMRIGEMERKGKMNGEMEKSKKWKKLEKGEIDKWIMGKWRNEEMGKCENGKNGKLINGEMDKWINGKNGTNGTMGSDEIKKLING